MSSQNSVVQVPSSFVGDAQPANWNLQHIGSVYNATLVAVADGETQGFAIDAYGRLMVMGSDTDNTAPVGKTLLVGGRYESALPTYTDGDVGNFHINSNGELLTRNTTLEAVDYATETTLDALLTAFNAEDFATQTTLNSLLTAFNAEDFATETTLAALSAAFTGTDFSTETTLNSLLTAFNAEDFASQTTLAAIATDIGQIEALLTTIDADTSSLAAEDFATETTLNSLLTAFNAEDFATETTLSSINTRLGTNAVLHAVYNSYSSSNLPGNATNPLQLVAALSANVRKIQVFDTGGVPFELMTGAAAAETRLMVIGPGADTELNVQIASGTRVSVRRVDSAAALTGGDISINFLS